MMKKRISLLLAVCLILALAGCGGTAAPADASAPQATQTPTEAPAPTEAPPPAQAADWTREGYYSDEDGNMLSVTFMDDVVDPGWYVGCMIGDTMAGNTIPQEGDTLHGDLNAWDESAEPFVVTVTEEGEDGLLLVVEGGGTYHFLPMELPTASIFISINTEGWGSIDYAEGEEAPEPEEYSYQSAQINLADPAVYTLVARPDPGSVFVKWTKNGEDFSTEATVTLLLEESAEFVAVFEDPDSVSPVANYIGSYQCGRARATVECIGFDEPWITIEWGSSAWELAQWDILGTLDADTMTMAYTGCTKYVITYGDDGEVANTETVYENGTGTVVFNEDGTFTWHEDQSEYGEDMVFEPVYVDGQNPVMNFVGNYQCGRARALVECWGSDGARITVEWSDSAWELARWEFSGPLNTDTLTVEYSDGTKTVVTLGDDGGVVSEEPVYENGTGTVVFNEDGTFTWHEDQSERAEDMVFEWAPTADE